MKRTDPFLEQLWRQYQGNLRRVLIGRFRVPLFDVDDVLGEVFLVACQHRKKIPPSEPWGWLCLVAKKTVANHRRRLLRRYDDIDAVDGECITVGSLNPEERAELRDAVGEVGRMLDAVDMHLIALHAVDGETFLELAERFGITKSGAHARWFKACARVRNLVRTRECITSLPPVEAHGKQG